jgi:hypothetical protein
MLFKHKNAHKSREMWARDQKSSKRTKLLPWIGYPLDEVLIISISGQDPGWLLCIDVENKIELFKPFRMVEVVVWG